MMSHTLPPQSPPSVPYDRTREIGHLCGCSWSGAREAVQLAARAAKELIISFSGTELQLQSPFGTVPQQSATTKLNSTALPLCFSSCSGGWRFKELQQIDLSTM